MPPPSRICRFDSADDLKGKGRTYEAVRAAVLEAGRFSVFEATNSAKDAKLFERLEQDPTVVVERGLACPCVGPVRMATEDEQLWKELRTQDAVRAGLPARERR